MPHRITYRMAAYARARGRNGTFVPRELEFAFSLHDDGTPLITIRVYSRRAGAAPIELTMALGEWESHALAIQLAANEERRNWRRRAHPGNR
jgi:hypothetical protein